MFLLVFVYWALLVLVNLQKLDNKSFSFRAQLDLNWFNKTIWIQLYPVIPPPDIPPNLLISTNLLCTEFFSYIKPLIHSLYRYPPRIFYARTRLLHREKWIKYRGINQWRNQSRHSICWLMSTCGPLWNSVV